MMTQNTRNLKPTKNNKNFTGVSPESPKAHQKADGKDKKDLKQEITNRIIELMEAGPGKWKKTWEEAAASGFPISAVTGVPYREVNVLLLWMATVESGYTSNKWMTYRQAQEIGAQVRKGEKSVSCVFFDMIKKKDAQEGEAGSFPMVKAFYVFNIDQIDNVPAEMQEEVKARPKEFNPIEEAEYFISQSGAHIEHRGTRACYQPSQDKILLPNPEAFITPENYYATAAHELTHWTGHKTRLDRDFSKSRRFGDEAYAFEELIAELGSAFLAGKLGFIGATVENHASYLANWVKVLKDDKNAIFAAAKHASAAYDYLTGLTFNQGEKTIPALETT